MKTIGILATIILVAGYLTQPHSLLGSTGMFLAGLTLFAIATTKAINLYSNREEHE